MTDKVDSKKIDLKVTMPTCGIVMPISEIDGCTGAHWKDVKGVIVEAAEQAGFSASLVSESEDIGVIQQRIVQNLYDCDIIVCDVSAKNANVMFELGLRLAFDKPAIVLKDDKTSYSFDTSPIEHIEYPRDLRYTEIQLFKVNLASKIRGTYDASKKPEFTTFLKHFGKFRVSGIETKEVSAQDYLTKELSEIRDQLSSLLKSRDIPRAGFAATPASRSSRLSAEILAIILFGLNTGELTPDDLTESLPKVYGHVYSINKALVDRFGSPQDFEREVNIATKSALLMQMENHRSKLGRTLAG